jgi:hypothetical protein
MEHSAYHFEEDNTKVMAASHLNAKYLEDNYFIWHQLETYLEYSIVIEGYFVLFEV